MGVLGGFKNMLRTWRNNLRKKKLKKKRKSSFLYNFIAIIIYPFSVIFDKSDKKKIQKPTVGTIEKKIDISKNIEEIKEVKEEFKQIKKEIDLKTQKIIEEKITKKEAEINKSNEPLNDEKVVQESPKQNKAPILNKQNDDIKIENQNIKNEEIRKQDEITSLEPITTHQFQEEDIEKQITKFDEKLNEELNKKIKKITEEIEKIEKYNESYQVHYKIKELKEKIEYLKQEYKNNNIIFEDNLSIDDIELLEKNVKKLEENLEIKKQEILHPKKEVEKEAKKEVKKEEKQEKKKKQVDEIELYRQVVIENIDKCNRYYISYLKDINKGNKRKSLFKYTNALTNSILSLMLGILPFGFIKNRLIKNYIVALNVNNSVRTINRMINPLDTNNYYVLFSEYRDLKEVIENTYSVMNDSLERVLRIKEELINLGVYNIDRDLYNKILNMERLINENVKQMDEKYNNLSKIYVKMKND